MARIFILSSRVSLPTSGGAPHPGGALCALMCSHPCIWMGRSGEVVECEGDVKVRHLSREGTQHYRLSFPSHAAPRHRRGTAQ